MDQHLSVLLYSKYSTISTKLLSIIESCPFNFYSTVRLQTVCIDNEDIREKILNTKKFEISFVPCILIVYQNGNVEKYEGNDAFSWIEEIIKNNIQQENQQQLQQQENQQQLQQENQRQMQQQENQQQMQQQYQQQQYQQQYQQPEQLEKHQQPQQEQLQRQQKQEKQKKLKKKNNLKLRNNTKIEDLYMLSDNYEPEESGGSDDSEYNLEINIDRNISKPIASVRNGPGSYELKNNFGKKQKQNTDVSRHVKKNTQKSDKDENTLMAAAMAIQKEREVESSKPNSVNQRPI